MRINYILVDLENIQPKNLGLREGHIFKVIVFVGANQAKLPFEFVSALQSLGDKAEYLKIDGNGPNALDFHIAFYIGQLAEREPNSYFHIISKYTGFDSLIKHLKSRKIFANRAKDLSEIPMLRVSNAKSTEDKITAIVDDLTKRGSSKPRKLVTLENTISSIFLKKLEDSEVSSLIEALTKRKLIAVNRANVSYHLQETTPNIN